MHELAGINIIYMYSNTIFKQVFAPGSFFTPRTGTYLISVANLFSYVVATWSVNTFGRKPLLFWGHIGIGFAHALIGAFILTGFDFGVVIMICVFIFMLERNKMTGSWDYRSFMWAFLGITLDAIGVMLTRSAYEIDPSLETFQVNVVRCAGALIGFFLISPKSYLNVAKDLQTLRKREVSLVVAAGIFGCFVSLALYLAALKFAHVGTLTAITITGPIWVSMLESLYHRKWPNIYLLGAFAFFLTGFYLMLIA